MFSTPEMNAINAMIVQQRKSRLPRFKLIGKGETEFITLNPPDMASDVIREFLLLVATTSAYVALCDDTAICLPLADARVL
jgi:hypothetical protein